MRSKVTTRFKRRMNGGFLFIVTVFLACSYAMAQEFDYYLEELETRAYILSLTVNNYHRDLGLTEEDMIRHIVPNDELTEKNVRNALKRTRHHLLNELKLDDKSRYISPEEYDRGIKVSDELLKHPITYHRAKNYTYIKPHRINKKIRKDLKKILSQNYIQSSLEEVIIIDLTGNPGGTLDDVVDMCSLFSGATEFFSVQGRAGVSPKIYGSNKSEILSKHQIIALIDNETASGAEIFAHCISSNPNSLLLGRHSAGAGSIQSFIPIDEGANGYLKITTGYVIFPDGTQLQGIGISPDHEVNINSKPDMIIDMIVRKSFRSKTQN